MCAVGDEQFTITVSTGSLSAAETLLGDLARNVEEEGTKLAALPGKAASWTGVTATTLKAEMTRIAGQMTSSPEHLTTAQRAVATFRGKVEDAQRKLADLNRRWGDTVTTYDKAVSRANSTYGDTVRPYHNLPPEDVGTARTDAATTRDNAITSAASTLQTAQTGLKREYEGLVHGLEADATTCGSALYAAVLVAVPPEVITSYLDGNNHGMGPGALDANFDKATRDARQMLTGDDSLVGKADDLRAGTELGNSVKDKVKKGQPLTPDEIAYLKANAKNQAFVEGFMTSMGPQALAALSFETLSDVHSPYDEDRKRGNDLKGALSDMYATGSHIQVDDGRGGQRYLMDDGWLDNFNPKGAWPQDWEGRFQNKGYAPEILVPFLTQPQSENFDKVVGNRWLRDYETAKNSHNLGYFYDRYSGPDGKDLSNIVFDRMGDYPNVANELMVGHLDTFNYIMTGQDVYVTHHVNGTDLARKLNTLLKTAVLDVKDADHQAGADYIVAGMGKYLADPANKNPKLMKEVLPALGEILVSPRFLQGQIMSVATPFAPDFDPKAGFPAYSRDPNMGLLMDPKLWEQLQQEALRRPENVTALLGATRDWVDGARRSSDGRAYTFDPDHLGPDGQPIPPYSSDGNYSVVAFDLYQQEAVRSFLGQNLLAVKGDLEAEMEQRMKDAGKPAEYGKAALGKIIGWVADPAGAPKDIATTGVTLAVDAAFGAYTKGQEDQIKADYDKQLGALNKAIDPSFTDPDFWADTDKTTDDLAVNFEPRRTPPSVWAEGDQAKGGPVIEYTGDPKKYIGHKSEYVGGGGNPVITDDFLEYGANGEVTGVMDPKQMNHLQREAYLNWLHDPAVQSHLDSAVDAVGTARDRVGK